MVPFLKSKLISWSGKIRMGLELLVPTKKGDADESLGSFVRRRLGSEALNKIAGPLMGGIHAADPERLSLKSTFPMFLEMEKNHGSLLRGMLKRPKQKPVHAGVKAPMFLSLRGGLKQLAEALVARLPQECLIPGRSVLSVSPEQDGYKVLLSDGTTMLAQNVVFATPSYVTADLVQHIDPTLAARLRAIRYVSTATVSLGFKRSEVGHPMKGSGFIVPKGEGRRITACSWSSEKFEHRAPQDSVLLRVFLGGSMAEDLAEQNEVELIRIAREEVHAIMGITAEPTLAMAYRWHKANPQYEVGHERRLVDLEGVLAQFPGIYLVGAAYRGSGIPDCIQSGLKAARSILTALDSSSADAEQPVAAVTAS
jgi:oxygen-dependent protoporphyrinogen oxidase